MRASHIVKSVELIIGVLTLLVSSLTYAAALGQPNAEELKSITTAPTASSPTESVALGQPRRTSMLGYSLGAALVSADDPPGNTKPKWIIQPIILVYTARFWNDSVRYWSELYYYRTVLDATPTKIGQDAKRFGMRLSFQKNLPITPKLSTWFGAGIDLSQEKLTTRHTVDSDGFLTEVFPDRKEITLAGIINVVGEWPLKDNWIIAAKLEQSIPINGYLKESLAAVTLLYRY